MAAAARGKRWAHAACVLERADAREAVRRNGHRMVRLFAIVPQSRGPEGHWRSERLLSLVGIGRGKYPARSPEGTDHFDLAQSGGHGLLDVPAQPKKRGIESLVWRGDPKRAGAARRRIRYFPPVPRSRSLSRSGQTRARRFSKRASPHLLVRGVQVETAANAGGHFSLPGSGHALPPGHVAAVSGSWRA